MFQGGHMCTYMYMYRHMHAKSVPYLITRNGIQCCLELLICWTSLFTKVDDSFSKVGSESCKNTHTYVQCPNHRLMLLCMFSLINEHHWNILQTVVGQCSVLKKIMHTNKHHHTTIATECTQHVYQLLYIPWFQVWHQSEPLQRSSVLILVELLYSPRCTYPE